MVSHYLARLMCLIFTARPGLAKGARFSKDDGTKMAKGDNCRKDARILTIDIGRSTLGMG